MAFLWQRVISIWAQDKYPPFPRFYISCAGNLVTVHFQFYLLLILMKFSGHGSKFFENKVKYAMSQCVVKATEYSKLPKNNYLLAHNAIIFDQNMTVFSPTQLIFLSDPKRAKMESVVCILYQKELYKLSMSKDN